MLHNSRFLQKDISYYSRNARICIPLTQMAKVYCTFNLSNRGIVAKTPTPGEDLYIFFSSKQGQNIPRKVITRIIYIIKRQKFSAGPWLAKTDLWPSLSNDSLWHCITKELIHAQTSLVSKYQKAGPSHVTLGCCLRPGYKPVYVADLCFRVILHTHHLATSYCTGDSTSERHLNCLSLGTKTGRMKS